MMDPDLEFVSEAEDLIEAVRRDLGGLSEHLASKTFDANLVNSLFRSLHSLKGLSSAVGLQQATSLAHQLEACLDRLRLGRQQATAHLLEILSESVTLMAVLVHRRPDPENRCAQMISLLEASFTGEFVPSCAVHTPPANLDPDLFQSLTTFEVQQLYRCLDSRQDVFLISCCLPLAVIHTALPEFEQLLHSHGQLLATIPGVLKDGGRIDFHLLFCGRMPQNLGDQLPAEYRLRVRAIAPGDSPKTFSADPSPPQPVVDTAVSSQIIRIESQTLDELLEISKNLVVGQGQLKRLFQQFVAEGTPESSGLLETSFQDMERGLLNLQRSLNDARMIPVRFLFQRMTRVVRSSQRGTGKRVRLVMRGSEVPLDRGVLEQLHEPLLHLVRNAIDHGIESPDERAACGKPAEGVLILEARQRSGQVTIEVRDDGRGIDLQQVRARASELGMVNGAEVLSNQQLYDLLFQPGLTTRTEVTEISGRGVGMDVVRCQLDSLCGLVEVDTRAGGGTCVTLTLPAHKTIMQVLVVTVADRLYAMSLEGVCYVKTFESYRGHAFDNGKISDGEAPLPLLDLRNHFHEPAVDAGGAVFLVVVGLGARQVGLVVEGLRGRREAVIRPFDSLLQQVQGFSAVAELVGTGPVLLLDLAYLIRQATREFQAKSGRLTGSVPEVWSDAQPMDDVLVAARGGVRDLSLVDGEGASADAVQSAASARGDFISFFLCGVEYALDIMEVVEIIERMDWITVPRTPSFISGVVLWRDRIVPVLDVAARIGIAKSAEISCGTVLVSKLGERKVAIAAERVGQLFHSSDGEESSIGANLSQISSPFFSRVVRREGRDVGVLDLAALLAFSVI